MCLYYGTRRTQDLYAKYGAQSKDMNLRSYAVVTGASDGIGLAYCKILAKQGFNIIMVSRSESKLKETQKQVQEYNKDVIVEICVQDLSQIYRYEDYRVRFGFLKKYDIALLINNAGVGQSGSAEQLSYSDYESIATVNILHPVHLTKFLLPQMLQRPQKGAVVVVSSLMELYCSPGHNMYANTKRFVRYFYEALSKELQFDERWRGKIDVQVYEPGFVATKMSKQLEGFTVPNTLVAAEGALKDLGRREITYAVIDHHIIGSFMEFISDNIPSVMGFFMLKRAKEIHDALSKKKQTTLPNVQDQGPLVTTTQGGGKVQTNRVGKPKISEISMQEKLKLKSREALRIDKNAETKHQKNNSGNSFNEHHEEYNKKRIQQQSQGSVGFDTPLPEKKQNTQFQKQIKQNSNEQQKSKQDYNSTPSQMSRGNQRQSRSDTRLMQMASSNTTTSNSTGYTTTQGNVSGSGSDNQFKSKQLLEQKKTQLRHIVSSSPNDRFSNHTLNSPTTTAENPSNSREGTPRSRSKNKRVIIDSNIQRSNNSSQLKQQHSQNNISSQEIQMPMANEPIQQLSRKIPIDKKKKILKVDQVQRAIRIANSSQQSPAEILKIHVGKNDNSYQLPTLKSKISPRIHKGTQQEGFSNNNMDKIEEESIQQFDSQIPEKRERTERSKFLQKIGQYQSTGDLGQVQEATDHKSIAETITQLKLKRESKTLPQLHTISPISDNLEANHMFMSNGSGNKYSSHLQQANEEILQLKNQLNFKDNQISALLKEFSNKSVLQKADGKSIFKKNPGQQPIQLLNLNRRGSSEESDFSATHKTAVPAVNLKKHKDHKTKIEWQKRAISQPGEYQLDQDRDELKQSIRKSKMNQKSNNPSTEIKEDTRGGSAQYNIAQKFQTQKEIFEYSPMVQNNYLDNEDMSPGYKKEDQKQDEETVGQTKRQAKTQNKQQSKKVLEIGSIENRESDKLLQLKGQKRQNDSAKVALNFESDQPRINSNSKEERKLQKPSGISKFSKKPIKLPFLNTAGKQQEEQQQQDNLQQNEMRGMMQQQFLKNNLVEKYQQYTQIYQKQINNNQTKLEQFKHDKQSFSTKNLHQQNSIKHLLDQESKSNDNNYNTLQKSQSKDSLNMIKLKNQIGNNSQNAVIKLQSNSSAKSKTVSLATLVIKKDQIKLNKIESINSNNTCKVGSIQNSDHKQTLIMESSDNQSSIQERFINESLKPSMVDQQFGTTQRESEFNYLEGNRESLNPPFSSFNGGLLLEDNPFIKKTENNQQQQQKLYQIPPQMMMMVPPPQQIFSGMPMPQMMADPRMNPMMYGMQPQPGYYFPVPYPNQIPQLDYPLGQQQQQQYYMPMPGIMPQQVPYDQLPPQELAEEKIAQEPLQLNKNALNPSDEENVTKYSRINPFDDDEELCNYEANDTNRGGFGKVLRESVPIVIVDDREDDDIRSSLYSIKSKSSNY